MWQYMLEYFTDRYTRIAKEKKEDARITGMKPHYEFSPVVEILHQFTLLLQVHPGRGNDSCARLCTKRKFLWHKASGIKYQIGFLEHLTASYAHKVGI